MGRAISFVQLSSITNDLIHKTRMYGDAGALHMIIEKQVI